MFEFFEAGKDADNFTEMFEFPVREDMLVSDLKKTIAPMLEQKNVKLSDPLHIRLRDLSATQYSRRLGKAFPDALTIKKATISVYSKRVAVEVLDGPETVTNDKDLVIFVQQFFPSKFALSKKESFVVNEETSLDEFREMLGAKFGIETANIGVLRVDSYYSFYDDPDLLDVPELQWDKPTVTYSTKNTVGDTLMMRNSTLVYVRDNTEKLKELTKEEKDAIKKEMSKRKASQTSTSSSYSFWNKKEKALKIQTSE